MDYNGDACIDLVRHSMAGLMDRPNKKAMMENGRIGYDVKDIETRIKTAIRGSLILAIFCEASGLDEEKLRKRILQINLPLLIQIKHRKEMYIKKRDGKWTIQ